MHARHIYATDNANNKRERERDERKGRQASQLLEQAKPRFKKEEHETEKKQKETRKKASVLLVVGF
jgi:hypothetical protein